MQCVFRLINNEWRVAFSHCDGQYDGTLLSVRQPFKLPVLSLGDCKLYADDIIDINQLKFVEFIQEFSLNDTVMESTKYTSTYT